MTNATFYYNGEWLDDNPRLIGPMDHAFWMSTIVFDGARAMKGLVPDIEAHCERLTSSARSMMLQPTMTAAEVAELCREAVRRLPRDLDYYIRPMYFARSGFVTPEPDSTDFVLAVYETPMPGEHGFSAHLSPFRRPARDMAPTDAKASCLYPNTQRALTEAARRGFDNAVILDPNGNVAEFGTANLWIARDGVAMTPAWNGTFLKGVTRQRVIGLLENAGIEVRETALTVKDLEEADEIFSTGNYGKVMPLTRFGDRELQPGPVYRRARELYFEFAAETSVF